MDAFTIQHSDINNGAKTQMIDARYLRDLLPFVLEDYFHECATPEFKAALEAACAAIDYKPQ